MNFADEKQTVQTATRYPRPSVLPKTRPQVRAFRNNRIAREEARIRTMPCPWPLPVRRADGPKRHRQRSVAARPSWMDVPGCGTAAGERRAPPRAASGNCGKVPPAGKKPGASENRSSCGEAGCRGKCAGPRAQAAARKPQMRREGPQTAARKPQMRRAKHANGRASRGKKEKRRRSAGCSTT